MRYLILLLLLSSSHLFSQSAPFKFGKIDNDDLKMTVYEPDTSAAAVVLGEFGELEFYFTNDDIGYRFKKLVRIKILKRSGFGYGNIRIPFYSKKNFESVGGIKATVYAPDGSETDLDRKEIFDEEINEYWSAKRFTLPNLQVGSIIDYQYETESKSIFQLPTWYFQTDIPVRWSELRMEYPEWYRYTHIAQGQPLDINEQNLAKRNLWISSNYGGGGNMDVQMVQKRMVMKDVPAMKEESYTTTMDDYYARIRFQLASFTYPNGVYNEVMGTWDKLYKELIEDDNFGDQYKIRRNYDDLWAAIQPSVPAEASAAEKASIIYHFLSSNIQVNGITSIYAKSKLNDCFEKKSARLNEMNLMLVALLRETGVEAYPVLISTRTNGKPMPLYPLMDQFNHVVALANLGDNMMVLDASDPFVPIGYPAKNSLNQLGWAVVDDNPQWIQIPTPDTKDTYFFKFSLDGEGVLDGNFAKSCSGYSASSDRRNLHKDPNGEYLKKLFSSKYPDATVDSITVENQQDLGATLKIRANCKIPGSAVVAGDFIYLSPAILSSFTESPFKLEKRLYPIDIPYPFQEQVILNIDLPEGHLVEELPESVRMVMPDGAGSFDFRFSQNGNTLQMISKLQINRLRFEVDEYAALRDFFSLVENKLGEQIVLRKE